MCGRVIQKTPLGEIRVLFETVNAVPNSAPNYNGAPTQQLPVVRLDEEGRAVRVMDTSIPDLVGQSDQSIAVHSPEPADR